MNALSDLETYRRNWQQDRAEMSEPRICPVIDLDEITARARRTANEIEILKMLVVVPLLLAGLVFAAVAVQGAENIRSTQIANMEP